MRLTTRVFVGPLHAGAVSEWPQVSQSHKVISGEGHANLTQEYIKAAYAYDSFFVAVHCSVRPTTMEKQTPMEMELDFEQLDSDLRHLSPIQRQEVLAAESFGNFPPKTRAKHAYLTEKLDAGPKVFSVPAGVIAALLEQAYDTKQNRADFKSRLLQVHPDSAKHWGSLPKSQVKKVSSRFCLPSAHGGDLEFPVPGEPGEAYWIRVSADPRTQYVLLTPIYARFLLSHSDDRLHTFSSKSTTKCAR